MSFTNKAKEAVAKLEARVEHYHLECCRIYDTTQQYNFNSAMKEYWTWRRYRLLAATVTTDHVSKEYLSWAFKAKLEYIKLSETLMY
jgi:hypothetical protein